MRQFLAKLSDLAGQILIVLLSLTFAVTGAIPANQIISMYDRLAAQEEATSTLYLQANPSDVEAQGDMAPTTKVDVEQPVITTAIQSQHETFNDSNSEPIAGDHGLAPESVSQRASNSLRTTASSISTALGLQFRLLGEKPSGTS